MTKRPLEIKEATSLLRNGPFRRLWLAQFLTMMVIYSLGLAGVVLVEEQTHSSVQTGLVIVSSLLPACLACLVSGAVVDRWGWTRSLVGSHLARAVVALAFWAGAVYLPPEARPLMVFAVNVATAIFSQFALPAELALLPDLVGHSRLISANALFQLSLLVGQGLSIVFLGPLIIKAAGVSTMGLVGCALCLSGLALVVRLPAGGGAQRREDTGATSVWAGLASDLRDGWATIARDRMLVTITAQLTLAGVLLLILLSLVPGLASRHLGLGTEDAPWLILPGGLGFLLGSVLMGRHERRLNRLGWIALGLTGLGASLALLALSTGRAQPPAGGEALPAVLWVMLLLIVALGVALALVIIPARTVLQERPPAAMRGRVVAAQLALANAAAVIPLLVGAGLADRLGIGPVMGLLSLLAAGAGALGFFQARS